MLVSVIHLAVGGMLVVLALCPLHEIAWRFVRMVSVLTMSLAGAVFGWFIYNAWWSDPSALVGGVCALLTGVVSMVILTLSPMMDRENHAAVRAIQVTAALGGTSALVGGLFWLSYFSMLPGTFGTVWIIAVVGNLSSAFLIGAVSIAWLLGHRYLTATEMTIAPLRRAGRLLLIAVTSRWIFLVVALTLLLTTPATMFAAGEPGMQPDWFMLCVRIGVGLVVPSVFAYMAWDCVKRRSTQSATGILFFASILIFIGELTSQYLGHRMGVPL